MLMTVVELSRCGCHRRRAGNGKSTNILVHLPSFGVCGTSARTHRAVSGRLLFAIARALRHRGCNVVCEPFAIERARAQAQSCNLAA